MFKVQSQLTNVRPTKTTDAEVETTPTSGNIKLNTIACGKLKATAGDYAVVVEASNGDEDAKLYIAKGHAGDKTNAQIGAKINSTTGKQGGSMIFSSENAYRTLKGTSSEKRVFKLGEGIESNGTTYFELIFDRTEAKMERKPAKVGATH